jgi:uncharacterized membrane protein
MKLKALISLEYTQRFLGIDALRGLIMMFMALDHARNFLCVSKGGYEIWVGRFTQYQGDLLAFMTRFVTHLAAPGFFFLMGSGMIFFYASRKTKGWTRFQITLYFAKRGALLIGLQFLMENPAWAIGFGEMPLYFGVLFALGCSMLLGILLLELPPFILGLFGFFLVAMTEILLPETKGYVLYPLHLRIWLLPGFTPGAGMFVLYPVMPWLGVTSLGMAFGKHLKSRGKKNPYFYLNLGLFLIVLFFAVRVNGGFGNIRLAGEDGIINFLNVVKYPPSISLLLITLGINFMALSLFDLLEKKAGLLLTPLVIFGRAPLFFYLIHLFLYAFMGKMISPGKLSLTAMYWFWILGLVILLPLCAVYAHQKQKSRLSSFMRLI